MQKYLEGVVLGALLWLFPLYAYVPAGELIKAYRGFEPNYGQVQDFEGRPVKDIIFSTKAPGLHLFFKKDGVSYVIYPKTNEELNSSEGFDLKERLNKEDSSPVNYARVDLELVGGNIDRSKIVFEDELPGYVNYYLPGCPEGITNLKTYRVVRVKDVYPGIDWVFRYDADGNLHHEFVVKPEGNPDEIRLKVKWADVKLSDDGSEIILSTPVGDILDGSIYAYAGDRRVKVNYVFDDGLLVYDVRGWSRNENLVIDPPLARLWATYYGGSSSDYAYSVATDPQGNVYVVGHTYSTDFPVYDPGGAYFQGTIGGGSSNYKDAFILKFDSSGVRLWATYYGGSSVDHASSVATDPQGNVYVVGSTYSTDFPVYDPGCGAYFQGSKTGNFDAFILKFDSSGVRLWATYYGGSGNDHASSVVTDPQGNIYVVGHTRSTNFPVYDPGDGAYYQGSFAGYDDAFILKFNFRGSRQWATYYGGSGDERAYSVATDPQGNVYVVGWTCSLDFPVYNPRSCAHYRRSLVGLAKYFYNLLVLSGAYYQRSNAGYRDAFILKFDSSGVRQWATYYGGSSVDDASSVATDPQGNVYVVGKTYSSDFPVYKLRGAYPYKSRACIDSGDAFILKFNPRRIKLQWTTYCGGSDDDYASSVATDPQGNVYVVGSTYSSDFPVYNPGGDAYYQGSNAGYWDAFILKFKANLKTSSGKIR
jgi:hypothetical protein